MFQIIYNNDKKRWEIKDTTDYFVGPGDTFHNYKWDTEEAARGVYMHHALQKEEGFTLEYLRETMASS